MHYQPKYDKVEDNLNLTRLRTAQLTEAINNTFQDVVTTKPEGFTLNDLMLPLAPQIETAEEGFLVGWVLCQQLLSNAQIEHRPQDQTFESQPANAE